MSEASREPEKYSVEEMMERLKAKPKDPSAEKGELVTRADGTQAIRIRKRKRRSRQPHKQQEQSKRRARRLQVTVALVLIVAIALTAGGLMVYANTSPYREALIDKAAGRTGAEIALREFRVTPLSANAASVRFSWPEGNALESLEMKTVEAQTHLSSFLGKAWVGEEITARQAHLVLRQPVAGAPRVAAPPAEELGTVNFNRIGIPELRITLGENGELLELDETEASFYPSGADQTPQLQLSRGRLKVKGWPAFRLDRSFLQFHREEIEVVSLRLLDSVDSKGTLLMSGKISPFTPERPSELAVVLESFPLAALVGEEFGKRVSGTMDSREALNSNFLSFSTSSEGDGPTMALAFRPALNSQLALSGFPFLTTLAERLDDNWFKQPQFMTPADGTFRRQAGNVRLGLELQYKGRMAISGEMEVAPDLTLTGSLEVGLADAVVEANQQAGLGSVFSRSADGFRWATVTLSGTAAMPADNLASLLGSDSPANALPRSSEAPLEEQSVPSFEDLTRPR